MERRSEGTPHDSDTCRLHSFRKRYALPLDGMTGTGTDGGWFVAKRLTRRAKATITRRESGYRRLTNCSYRTELKLRCLKIGDTSERRGPTQKRRSVADLCALAGQDNRGFAVSLFEFESDEESRLAIGWRHQVCGNVGSKRRFCVGRSKCETFNRRNHENQSLLLLDASILCK